MNYNTRVRTGHRWETERNRDPAWKLEAGSCFVLT
jgi:hypothetical protein